MFSLTQDYFLVDSAATPVDTPGSLTYGYKWYIPFTYQTPTQMEINEITRKWLVTEKQSLSVLGGDYILGNIGAYGFYRVNYDKATWSKLINELRAGKLENFLTENRAQMIDDAFNLVKPNRLDIEVALDLTLYLEREVEYVPWRTFLKNIKYLEYMLSRAPVYGSLKKYVLQLIEPTLYEKLGWDEPNKNDDALIERMTRQVGIEGACYYGSKGCISHASDLFRQWMQDPDNNRIISSTYRNDVYCAAIRNGGIDEWNFAWDRHNASTNAQEKASLRYGMACNKDPWILSRYMEYCIDPLMVRSQDSIITCLAHIGEEDYGRDLAWAFIMERWDFLVEQYGSGIVFDQLIAQITKRFSTEYDLDLLQDFKNSTYDFGTAARAVDQAIERTRANIQWRKTNEKRVEEWLKAHVAV